jgi:hypothetical protein
MKILSAPIRVEVWAERIEICTTTIQTRGRPDYRGTNSGGMTLHPVCHQIHSAQTSIYIVGRMNSESGRVVNDP